MGVIFYCTPQNHISSLKSNPLIDCAGIIFGIIRHYKHNFPLFSEKINAPLFTLLASFATQKYQLLILIMQQFV